MTAFPAAQYILPCIFAVFAVMAVTGALIAALTTRVIRSVCGLALCCFGLAGLYYFLHSPLLALMEILIYVGAVCVTIVFAVMLAETDEPARTEHGGAAAGWGMLALATSGAAFWGILWLGLRADWAPPAAHTSDGSVQAIGVALLTTYSMAFELISLVLLVAILGALVIARTGRTKP
jgi:NADH:ubiquinone oxidoreductase subunit 6 (subunit J)